MLSACDSAAPTAPRQPAQGEAARAEVDRLTRAYGACVDTQAKTAPVAGTLAGTLADEFQRACVRDRVALKAKTASFYQIGHPKASAAIAAAVAEASIKDVEDEIQSRAVVTIIERQNPTKAK